MVGEICTKPAITASPETTVREAAHRMRSRKVGALVVINGSGTPVGLVTDRDITVKVVAQGVDPASVRVGSLVTRKPTVIREDAGILDATKLLSRRGIRRPGGKQGGQAGRHPRAGRSAHAARQRAGPHRLHPRERTGPEPHLTMRVRHPRLPGSEQLTLVL
jgi:hypothetical protein